MKYLQRQQLIHEAVSRYPDLERLPDRALAQKLALFISEKLNGRNISPSQQLALIQALMQTMRGFDVIDPLVKDPSISEIMINGPYRIFIEQNGCLSATSIKFDDKDHLMQWIYKRFGEADRLINEQHPIGSLRFPDGSRLQAVLPPASPDGPIVSLRRFGQVKPTLEDLIQKKSLTADAALFLKMAVVNRKNLFVCGGTGTGKTTFLNALSRCVPTSDRIITIEDTAELDLSNLPNLVRLEAREGLSDDKGTITLEELILSALRLRPDRIVVGEVRGGEAFPMIEAMRTGHPGSMSTGHATSPKEMVERLGLWLLMSLSIPWEAILKLICDTLDCLVQLERLPNGQRQVSWIGRVVWSQDKGLDLIPYFHRPAEELEPTKFSEKVFSSGLKPLSSLCSPLSTCIRTPLRLTDNPKKKGASYHEH